MAGITARSLSVQRSGEVHLTFPDLQLEWGQNWVLLGPSGSGKTTLLHLLSGLLRPTRGQLLVDGQDLGQLSENQLDHYRRSQVSYLFQDFHLLEGYTALENVVLALGLAGKRGGSAYRRASEVLAEAGLAHRLHHTPRQLSTGERQRVALARAVVHQPRLILADEPTAHLDRERGQASLQMLMDAASRLGALLVVATHDPLVTPHFDRRIELMRGSAG